MPYNDPNQFLAFASKRDLRRFIWNSASGAPNSVWLDWPLLDAAEQAARD